MARFAQGKFTLKNPDKYAGNKTPTYRSSWEFAFMRFCDEHASVTQWASEAIRIPYRNPLSGKYTIYVPDFFIAYADKLLTKLNGWPQGHGVNKKVLRLELLTKVIFFTLVNADKFTSDLMYVNFHNLLH